MSHFPNENDPGFVNPGNIPLAQTVQRLSSSPASSSILIDNFSRSNTTPSQLGISDNGWLYPTLVYSGIPSGISPVTNNTWISEPGVSCLASFYSPIKVPSFGLTGSFIFNAGSSNQAALAMGLCLNPTSVTNILNDCIWLQVKLTSFNFSFRTSGSQFPIDSGSLSRLVLNQRYTFCIEIKDDFVTITIGPYYFTYYSYQALLKGVYRNVFFGHFYGSSDTSSLSRIHSLWTSDITR
jgi:hypothetical protein